MEPEGSLPRLQVPATCPYPERISVQVRGFLSQHFATRYIFTVRCFLAPRPTPKLKDHPLLDVCACLFNIFAAALHIEGRSSIRKPKDVPRRGYMHHLITAEKSPSKLIFSEFHMETSFFLYSCVRLTVLYHGMTCS